MMFSDAVKWLDKQKSYWRELVYPHKLDMHEPKLCVLGQVYGAYWMSPLIPQELEKYFNDNEYRQQWIDEIRTGVAKPRVGDKVRLTVTATVNYVSSYDGGCDLTVEPDDTVRMGELSTGALPKLKIIEYAKPVEPTEPGARIKAKNQLGAQIELILWPTRGNKPWISKANNHYSWDKLSDITIL